MNKPNITPKINRILNGILILIFLMLIRVWYLSIYQHEEKEKAAEKPQKRISLIKPDRATIQDRFGIPLAVNKVQYNVTINYGEIQEIPRFGYEKDESGKKIKIFKRKEYIKALSHKLSEILGIDPERTEDIIHAKVSTLGRIPYVIKENITETHYFRIKMLEKDWPGLHGEMVARRIYPWGALGGEVIGYLGPISRQEYDAITLEIADLQRFLSELKNGDLDNLPSGYKTIEDVEKRLYDLEKRAYTINDFVGKSGVEKTYDERLKGTVGRKGFCTDVRGNTLQELPNAIEPAIEPGVGNRICLSISKELQEYAESLLAEYERAPCSYNFFPENGSWIKGGAIVALEPNTGEVLALASYPRFNPNDFIREKEGINAAKKNIKVLQWIEHESFLGSIWDGKEELTRERFDIRSGSFFEETAKLTWETYLETIFQEKSAVKKALKKIKNCSENVFLQNKTKELLALFEGQFSAERIFNAVYNPEIIDPHQTLAEKESLKRLLLEKGNEIEKIKKELQPYFQGLNSTYDKLLLVDLCMLALNSNFVSEKHLERLGDDSITFYRNIITKLNPIQDGFRAILKDIFHQTHFKEWKEKHFKNFLAEKRKEEKTLRKKYIRPYVDYLDEAETHLFADFFSKYKLPLLSYFFTNQITDSSLKEPFIAPYLSCLSDLKCKILKEKGAGISWGQSFVEVHQLLNENNISRCLAYLSTFRPFEELNCPLLGKYRFLRGSLEKQTEKQLAMAFYPKYGYGYLRSHAFRQGASIGSIFKLIPAYEAMRERYLEKGTIDLNPLTIIDDKHVDATKGSFVGFTIDNKPIPLIYRGGRLPRSDHAGVGKVDLVKALEKSSNPYFAILSGDVIHDPEDLCRAASLFSYGAKTGIELPGEAAGNIPSDVIYNRSGLYAMAIGQHSLSGTPLQTAVMLSTIANGGQVLVPKIVYGEIENQEFKKEPIEIVRQLFLPKEIRQVLLKGMRQVIHGEGGTARGLKNDFSLSLLEHIVGKTSTAELVEAVSIDGKEGIVKCKDTWFGSIYFKDSECKEPELVVVVYLRYGEYGWKAAPLAVKTIQKFLEIQRKNKK